MAGRETPVPHTRVERPGYRYDDDDWIAATAFDWIEQPLAAIADAFFDFITHHHDPVGHGVFARGGHGVSGRS